MKANKKELDRNISIFGAFLVICACLALIFYAFYQIGLVSNQDTVSVGDSKDESEQVIVRVPGWKDLVFSKGGLSMQYPSEMELRENEDGSVSMVIFGPSQSRGTEVYDGIILNLSTNDYSGDFTQFVKNEHERFDNDEGITEVSNIVDKSIGGKKGYEFYIEGLGRFTQIYLPVTDGKYLLISYLLEDPKNQGFLETLEKIFETIRFE